MQDYKHWCQKLILKISDWYLQDWLFYRTICEIPKKAGSVWYGTSIKCKLGHMTSTNLPSKVMSSISRHIQNIRNQNLVCNRLRRLKKTNKTKIWMDPRIRLLIKTNEKYLNYDLILWLIPSLANMKVIISFTILSLMGYNTTIHYAVAHLKMITTDIA